MPLERCDIMCQHMIPPGHYVLKWKKCWIKRNYCIYSAVLREISICCVKKNRVEMFCCHTQTTAKKHLIGKEAYITALVVHLFLKIYLTGTYCYISELHFPEVTSGSNNVITSVFNPCCHCCCCWLLWLIPKCLPVMETYQTSHGQSSHERSVWTMVCDNQ